MSDLQIDDFYRNCALILKRLYRTFPQKTVLYVEDITGPDEPDEFGLHCQAFVQGFSAMLWLADEGYLRYEETIRQEALEHAVLTQKGFLMLSSQADPASEERELTIDVLRKALKERNSLAVEKIMQSMLRR